MTALYAAAHSLGPVSAEVVAAIAGAVDAWSARQVGGWDAWIDLPMRIGDRLGAELLGAAPGQVVVADNTTVNLYKLVNAALDARPDRDAIVIDEHEFPTDRYVVEGVAAARGLRIGRAVDRSTALVVRSLVDFRTSRLRDMAAETAAAADAGALVVWDLSHAVGVVPVNLDDAGADLAVGCTYKYVAAGPGAPAFVYVRRDLQARLRQPIWGWFGQRDQFAMGPAYDPVPGIERFQTGTPPVIAMAAVEAAVDVIARAGLDDVRARSLALTQGFMSSIADAEIDDAVLDLATRRDESRGGHVALRVGDAAHAVALEDALREQGVIVDTRADLVRVGFAPLSTSDDDVARVADAVITAARSISIDRASPPGGDHRW